MKSRRFGVHPWPQARWRHLVPSVRPVSGPLGRLHGNGELGTNARTVIAGRAGDPEVVDQADRVVVGGGVGR